MRRRDSVYASDLLITAIGHLDLLTWPTIRQISIPCAPAWGSHAGPPTSC